MDILNNYISIPERIFLYYYCALTKPHKIRKQLIKMALELQFKMAQDHLFDPTHKDMWELLYD
jgi:hypothetical protein